MKKYWWSVLLMTCFAVTTSKAQTGSNNKITGYAPADDINIYYEIYGQGKPVVLLHGAFMTIGMNWSQIIPELSKTRKVIALEMQGHGHTALGSRGLSFTTLANDVIAVLKHLNIDSTDIVGYSFGGTITYELLINHPQVIKKAVIISSTYRYDGWQKEVRDAFQLMQPAFLSNSPLKTEYVKVAPDSSQWNNFLTKMIAFDKQEFNLGDKKIQTIKSPVLIISGDNDGIDKEVLFKTYQSLGGCRFADITGTPKSQLAIIPGQGHVSVMMQSSTLVNYIQNFLN